MRIQTVTREHRNDFQATLECEHCTHTGTLTGGYHDAFYHGHVIPSIICAGCGKNRAGHTTPHAGVNGVVTV